MQCQRATPALIRWNLTAPDQAQTPQEQGQDMEHLSPATALKHSSNKAQIFEDYYMLLLFQTLLSQRQQP